MIEDEDIQNYLAIIEKSKDNDQFNDEKPRGQRNACNAAIDPSCDLRGMEKMRFGDCVIVQKDCWLNIAFNNPDSQYIIDIGEGSNIGRRCTISGANRIVIGKNVLLGPNVFVADTSHEYRHAAIPIMHQEITTHQDEIHIGDGTWIGTNSVVVGNVKIGKHCVIGANSVVNRNIPDYCVAAGNPCRVVRVFDVESGTWAKVGDNQEVERYLSKRSPGLLEFLVPITSLKKLQVEVASACNLKCPQCFRHIEGHRSGFFTRELWSKAITPLFRHVSDIHLVGIGEPLLCKDFFFFVDDAIGQNIRVHTTSNLQLVNEEIAEKIVLSGICRLSFSCDGATKETYEKIRVNGKFERLKSSLELINKFKAMHNRPLPQLVLNFGAMKSNIHELPQVVEFAKRYDAELVIAYHNVIYVSGLKEESLYHYQELSDRKFLEARRIAESLGVRMFSPGLFSRPLRQSKDECHCVDPFESLYIYSDGRVGPCCMDFPERHVLGDIRDSSIEDVWNSFPILNLRKELTHNPSETCRYCVSHKKMDISDPKFFFRFKGSEEYLRTLEAIKRDSRLPETG
jgi:radical SAM protein with 4Fe4S-binding SPASM domain